MSDGDQTRRAFDCPIEWCDGSWIDHGGMGHYPDLWEHYGILHELPHGAFVQASSQGAGRAELTVAIDAQLFDALPPHTASIILREIADAIDLLHLDA